MGQIGPIWVKALAGWNNRHVTFAAFAAKTVALCGENGETAKKVRAAWLSVGIAT
jgi:hypothetical protein